MTTILVSGASGIIGYGILRSLRKVHENVTLIGTSIYTGTIAEHFSDIFEVAPNTNDDGYIGWLDATIRKHAVDLVVPGIEIDMYKWSENLHEMSKNSRIFALNRPELIALCKDKWVFYGHLAKLNPAFVIDSSLDDNFDLLAERFGVPFILKPRHGHAARGIVRVADRTVFLAHRENIGKSLMSQALVGSDEEEYTVSVFGDGNGDYCAQISLRRRLSKDGYTDRAEVVKLDEAQDVLRELCRYFRPLGPTNFQFRKHAGALKLLEINPRISSSTSMRTAFGYNESAMLVDFFLEKKLPRQPKLRYGEAVRYVEDLVSYK